MLRGFLNAVVCFCTGCPLALAQVQATVSPSGQFAATPVYTDHGNNEWSIDLQVNALTNPGAIVTVSGTNAPIVRSINVKSIGSGKLVNLRVDGSITSVRNIDVTSDSTGELWIGLIQVSDDTGGPSPSTGSIRAHRLLNIAPGRDCLANLRALGSVIDTSSPSISTVQPGRDIRGSVIAEAGRIGSVVAGGSIFSGGGNPRLLVLARADIDTVRAQEIDAAIATGFNNQDAIGNPQGNIRVLQTTGISGLSGDFNGQLLVKNIVGSGAGVRIFGDLRADFSTDGSAPLAAPIVIGGSLAGLASQAAISLLGGLEGQVTVNGRNQSGAWQGGVRVTFNGTQQLISDVNYTATAASLGGGAIGLAPFRLHGVSCSPVNGGTAVGAGYTTSCLGVPPCCPKFREARIRLYGPVEFSGNGPHVTVEYQTSGGWVQVGWEPQAEILSASGSREIRVYQTGNSTWGLGTYRIRPISGKIKCVGVANGDVDVDAFTYTFTLVEDCDGELLRAFDLDHNSLLNSGDLAAWVASPSDLNGDAAIDSADATLLINALSPR